MALASSWNPFIDIKRDPLQLTFDIPISILPLARQVIYMRYASLLGQGFGKDPNFITIWVDEMSVNGKTVPIDVPKSDSLDQIPKLPQTLVRTKITLKARE